MPVAFSGLISGLDTASLVSSLVSAERASASPLQTQQSDLNTQKSIVGSLSTALASLGTLARGMDITSEVQLRTASSSDGRVTVAASSSAVATVHSVRVQQLARAQIASSKTFATNAAGAAGAGSLKITTASGERTISWTEDDSLDAIASKINDANAGTTASVLFDGTSYRLMLAATETGKAAAPKFTDGGDGLDLANPANITVEARDAIVEIDGVTVTRGKNQIDDAVPGLTLTAVSVHGAADPDAAVSVSLDRDGVKSKLKALVAGYNAVNSALHVQLDYTGTKKGSNTLFGDATLRQLQGQLGSLMSSAYGGATLSSIGIMRDKEGMLTLDESKLADALAKNPDAVAKVFVTGGFATSVAKLTDQYTRAGDGILAAKTASMTSRHKALQSQIDRINMNADSLKTRLETQFSKLEQAMSALQRQSSYLSRML
ncbi:MAG: flagellar filament capping protein FliD [Deltaproteobacteria bacterium]|nr:flagellar filament capping protein FliD [Deltaproteobacteria bacterium]